MAGADAGWPSRQRAIPTLIAYRDGILFQQTVHRYASAWHHVQALVLLPRRSDSRAVAAREPAARSGWCRGGEQRLRERDARVWLPLAWIALVLVFFSASAGKRGVYIFPALPALMIAAAPYLPELFARRAVRYASVVWRVARRAGGGRPSFWTSLGNEAIRSKLALLEFDPAVRAAAVCRGAALVAGSSHGGGARCWHGPPCWLPGARLVLWH